MFIEGFQIYQIYTGLKQHFYTKSYDYWKYNKKTRLNKNTFEKRNDRNFFYVMNNFFNTRKELEEYFISGFKHENYYISEFVRNKGMMIEYLKEHSMIINSLKNAIIKDLNKIETKDYIISGEIFKDCMRDDINLETMCFFDIFFALFTYYDKYFNNIQYQDKKIFLKKYNSYLINTIKKDLLMDIKKIYYNKLIKRS